VELFTCHSLKVCSIAERGPGGGRTSSSWLAREPCPLQMPQLFSPHLQMRAAACALQVIFSRVGHKFAAILLSSKDRTETRVDCHHFEQAARFIHVKTMISFFHCLLLLNAASFLSAATETAAAAETEPHTLGSDAMFDNIAPLYDTINSIMSLYQHRKWRKSLLTALNVTGPHSPQSPHFLLDVGTGTGDVILESYVATNAFMPASPHDHSPRGAVGVDPSKNMLAIAANKTAKYLPTSGSTKDAGERAFSRRLLTPRLLTPPSHADCPLSAIAAAAIASPAHLVHTAPFVNVPVWRVCGVCPLLGLGFVPPVHLCVCPPFVHTFVWRLLTRVVACMSGFPKSFKSAQTDATIEYHCGDIAVVAESLPAATFTAATVSFAIRNIPDRATSLCAIHHLLQKLDPAAPPPPTCPATGATLTTPRPLLGILEVSYTPTYLNATVNPLKLIASYFTHYMVPAIGTLIGKSVEYTHLRDSLEAFPDPRAFIEEVEGVRCGSEGTGGFRLVEESELFFGTIHQYIFEPVE